MQATDQHQVPRLGTATGGGIESAAQAGGYVCPMCPDVREDGPAACPKCGMALPWVLIGGCLVMHLFMHGGHGHGGGDHRDDGADKEDKR